MAISVGSLKVDMGADPSQLINALNQASGAFQKTSADASAFTSVLGGLGSVAAVGLGVFAAGVAGVTAAAGAALGAWTQLDDAADTLTLKVGATGAALDTLTASVQNVYNSSAGLQSGMGDIAAAMGQVQQITGATGPALEGITAQFLYMQQAEGQAAGSTESFARAMQSWNVPAAEMSAELDKQYAAFQKTGIGAGELNQALVQFGGQLRQMGLTLNQAEGLLSGMYSAGINTEKALAALSTAAGKFAKDGVDMASGLRTAVDEIKNVENPTKAAQIAVETFGARAGPALADAIRQGKVSLEGLQASLGDTEGALKKSVEATMDFPEKIKLMGREIMTALQPAGTAIANSLGKALDEAKPAIDRLAASVGQMAMKIGPALESAFGTAKQYLAPLLDAAKMLEPTVEQLGAAFGRLGEAIGGALGMDAGAALSGWNDAVLTAAAWTQLLTEKLTALVDTVAGEVQPAVMMTGEVLGKIGDVLTNNVLPPLATLLGPLKELNDHLMALNPVTMALGNAMQSLGMDLGDIDWTRAGKAAQALYDSIVLVLGDVIQAANIGMTALGQILAGNIQGGVEGFKAGMEDLRVDHQAKWTAIEAHLQMSMVSVQSSIATGMGGWQSVFGAGLTGMVQQAADAAAQIREHMRLIQLGTQLGRAGAGQLDPMMHPELMAQLPAIPKPKPVVPPGGGGGGGNVGPLGKAAGEAKKTAEEMAKQAAETLKAVMDSVEKMKEFLDKGYSALVGDGALAGKMTDLSQALFTTGRVFADQLAAASQGMSEEAVKAAGLGSQAIGGAASALKGMVELLPKMWEFSQTEAWAAVQSSPALFTGMAATLIDMGRAFYDEMAAASVGVEESSVKAAGLLAQGIQAASSAISSVISAVKGMWEMYASGLWDEVQANKALLLQMSAWLIDMGREMFTQFAAAAAGVDKNAVKAAGLLSTGIQSATSAIGATLKLVQDLLAASFDPSFLDALFGETRGQIMAIANALIDLGREIFDRFADAAGGIQAKTVAAATLLSNGVKAAADGLKAAADSVRLLLDIGFDAGAVAALEGGSRLNRWVLGVADMLSQFARDITDRWAAAGLDLGSRVVAAAKRLSDGAKAAGDGLKSAADSLTLLLNIGFVGPAVEAMGGVGAGEMTRLQRWVLGVADMLANMARLLTEEWGRVGGALGSQVVTAAERLSSGIKSAQEGIKAAGEAIQTLLDLDTALAQLPTGAALPPWLVNATAFLGNIALIAVNEWGRIGNALQAGAASGAASLASGIKSVADGFKGVLDALTALLDAGDVTSRLPAGGALPGWLLNATAYLGNIALIVVNEWGRIGAALQANATVAADNLAKGVGSVANGLRSVVDALAAILDAGKVTAQLPTGAALPGWLVNVTAFLGNVALIMATEWGRIGAALQAGATVAADNLAKGVQSVASGITATVDALKAILDSEKTLAALPKGDALPPWLLNLTSYLANIALIMVNEWGRIGAALDKAAVEGAAALASGVQSVAGAVKGVFDTLALLTGKDAAKTLAALPGGADLAPWLRGLSEYLANIALIMVNEWGRIGAALDKAAVDAAAQLSSGIGSVSSALAATVDMLRKLADWVKHPVELTAQITGAAATLATDATELWKAVADALVKVAPPTEAQTAAVKAWTEVADFTSQALSMTDTLVKLSDWLKKPALLTPQMKAAAATLAQDWTTLWFVIADALKAITPPDEDQQANTKAWSSVTDFTSQALSMIDTITKLQDWLKKPGNFVPAMKTAAAMLAQDYTELWWAIRNALVAFTPPDEDQQANVKAWAGVADFTSQALSMTDTIVKLSDWLKKPALLSEPMIAAAVALAQSYTVLWRALQEALDRITPPTEAEDANTKAWAGVSDFTSQALGMTDVITKLFEWVKTPGTLTPVMISAVQRLAVDFTRLWAAIRDALASITPPTEDEQANTKAWAAVSDFTSQALGMTDSIVKLSDWLKKPGELTSEMIGAAARLAVDYTRLWVAIEEALAAIAGAPKGQHGNRGASGPTTAQDAVVKAWAGVSDFTSQALGMMDAIKKLADWLKAPMMLTSSMQQAAGILAQQYTQLWRTIQEVLDSIRPPTEAEQANTKAWAGVSDFTSQSLGMMDNLKKLDEWLKKPLTLTEAMKTAAGNLAVEFTQLWRAIQTALDGITPPTELEQAGVKAWAAVADAFGIVTKTLDLTKSLMEFYWTDKATTTDGKDIINKGIPGVAAVQARVAAALNLAVMMLEAVVDTAKDPALQSKLDQAAQDATKALSDVAGEAFGVIGGVLGVVKSLFEFGTTSQPGWLQLQGGNNIWTQGSFTPGIPDSQAVGAKVRALMAALQQIVEEVRTGAGNIDIGTDPAALQTKLSTVEALITSIANIVAKVQSIAGATGFNNFSMRIALAFDIPDVNAELAKIIINPLHVPVTFDLAANGSGYGSATTNYYNTAYNTNNTSITQTVPGAVASITAGIAVTQGALFGSSPV